jgi:hypothetical protein
MSVPIVSVFSNLLLNPAPAVCRRQLPAPFGRRIAESLDTDTAGQATFYSCFDKIGLLSARRLTERHPDATALPPNDVARIDFLFGDDNQCELIGNAGLRSHLERKTAFRNVADRTRNRHVTEPD